MSHLGAGGRNQIVDELAGMVSNGVSQGTQTLLTIRRKFVPARNSPVDMLHASRWDGTRCIVRIA